jgi:hyperosmotically inducible periplasmic protein
MNRLTGLPALLLAATTMAVTTACDNTHAGASKDAEIAAEQARQSGERAAEATREAAREAGPAVREAGDAVADAAASVKDAAETSTTTVQVKSALLADTRVDASKIDVDTDTTRQVVTLRGSVPTAAQKATAERIARDKAEGFVVVNELKIAG